MDHQLEILRLSRWLWSLLELLLLLEDVVHVLKHLLLNLLFRVGVVHRALSLRREHLTLDDRLAVALVLVGSVVILVLNVDVVGDHHLVLGEVFVHRLNVVGVHRLRNVLLHGRAHPILCDASVDPRRYILPHLSCIV